jgi:hypothetical protein
VCGAGAADGYVKPPPNIHTVRDKRRITSGKAAFC